MHREIRNQHTDRQNKWNLSGKLQFKLLKKKTKKEKKIEKI